MIDFLFVNIDNWREKCRNLQVDIKPQLTPNSLAVLRRRYLTKNDQGQVIETPEELFVRVATTIAAGDANFGANPEEVEETAKIVLSHDGQARILAELADSHERRTTAWATFRLFCAADR